MWLSEEKDYEGDKSGNRETREDATVIVQLRNFGRTFISNTLVDQLTRQKNKISQLKVVKNIKCQDKTNK